MLTRLRIGHTRTTLEFLLKGPCICKKNDEDKTVQLILTHCLEHGAACRRICDPRGSRPMALTLNNYDTTVQKLFHFLQLTHYPGTVGS